MFFMFSYSLFYSHNFGILDMKNKYTLYSIYTIWVEHVITLYRIELYMCSQSVGTILSSNFDVNFLKFVPNLSNFYTSCNISYSETGLMYYKNHDLTNKCINYQKLISIYIILCATDTVWYILFRFQHQIISFCFNQTLFLSDIIYTIWLQVYT